MRIETSAFTFLATASFSLPATGGYVGVISDNLPHSTQDVSVH